MASLPEIITLFELFGFNEQHVRQALAAGDSAFNAFEGLKTTLQLRWGEMCQELSVDKQKELRPVYDRLMGITMKSRKTKKSEAKKEQRSVRNIFDDLSRTMDERKRRRGEEFTSQVRENLRRAKRAGKLDAEGERRARATGLFTEDEEGDLMTERVVKIAIRCGDTNCMNPEEDWQCPYLRRGHGDMLATCTLFPTNSACSYTHLTIQEGWILRCELCRQAEGENPVVFRNETGVCPNCRVRIVTSYPPQEVPPTRVRCHNCDTELGPKEIRAAVEEYAQYERTSGG
jgi:hypothetical protein